MECLCGCGRMTRPGSVYISGHNNRGTTHTISYETQRRLNQLRSTIPSRLNRCSNYRYPRERKLCSCGCGELTNPGNTYINGHNSVGNQNALGSTHTYYPTKEAKEKKKRTWESHRDKNVRNTILASKQRPTGPELIMMDIIKDYNLPFRYNGNNAGVIIGGLCPDFISTNGVKVVLLVDGHYYHSDMSREIEADEAYRNNGYEAIHFTDTELCNTVDNFIATEIELKMKEVKRI